MTRRNFVIAREVPHNNLLMQQVPFKISQSVEHPPLTINNTPTPPWRMI